MSSCVNEGFRGRKEITLPQTLLTLVAYVAKINFTALTPSYENNLLQEQDL